MSQPSHGPHPAHTSRPDAPSAHDAESLEHSRRQSASDPRNTYDTERPRTHMSQLPPLATLTGGFPSSRPGRSSGVHAILNEPGEARHSITSPRTASDDSAISPLTRPMEHILGRNTVAEPRAREQSPATRTQQRESDLGAHQDVYRQPGPPTLTASDTRRQSASPYNAAPPDIRGGGSRDYGPSGTYRESLSAGSRPAMSPYAIRPPGRQDHQSLPSLPPPISTQSAPPHEATARGPVSSSPYSAGPSASATSSSSFQRQGHTSMAFSGPDGPISERSAPLHLSESGGPFAYGSSLVASSAGIQFPIDVQAASKVADEKRRRNAGASARFRARRKEKEQANTREIEDLRTRIRELEEDAEFYRRERDYFVAHLYNAPDRDHHFPRPPSPRRIRMQRAGAGLSGSSIAFGADSSTTYQEIGERGGDGRSGRRRLTGEYGSGDQGPPPSAPRSDSQSHTSGRPAESYAVGRYGPVSQYGGPATPSQVQPGTPSAGPSNQQGSYFASTPGQSYGSQSHYTLPPPHGQPAHNQQASSHAHPHQQSGSGSHSSWIPPGPPSR